MEVMRLILDDITRFKAEQLEKQKKAVSEETLIKKLDEIEYVPLNFQNALKRQNGNQGKLSIIAEIKKASPSRGIIKEDFNHIKTAESYEKINIDAVSVLTEKHFFKGDNSFIKDVKQVLSKPILRKDFIIDEYQVYEARLLNADAVLLITAILNKKLEHYYNMASKLGLSCLVEVHDRNELETALEAGCKIIGINNRNLKTFQEDIRTTERLLKYIPDNRIVVSESGMKNADDIRYIRELGVSAVLVGETFMRNIEDEKFINSFIQAAKD